MALSYGTRRAAMVAGLRLGGITDPRVLAAMGTVPRERFVPPELAERAYAGRPAAIGCGQTLSAPGIVALMTQALALGGDAEVLEVGTGSGYGAAVLACCARRVTTIERHGELADRARTLLGDLGYDNVEVRHGDGTLGAADRAPFDAIAVTALAPALPPALLAQLHRRGTLICPVGLFEDGELIAHHAGHQHNLGPVRFVPLIIADPPG